MRWRTRLTVAEARRIALAAQGFARSRPAGAADARHLRRVVHSLGLLQLDFVNVLLPAHYLVFWSRLGAYDRDRLDALAQATPKLARLMEEHLDNEERIILPAIRRLLPPEEQRRMVEEMRARRSR